MSSQLTAFEISEAELLLNFIRELVDRNEIKALRKLFKKQSILHTNQNKRFK